MKNRETEHRATAKTALKGSIKKWFGVWHGVEEDRGSKNCDLCHQFLKSDCVGCIISEAANEGSCTGTPYSIWQDLWHYGSVSEKQRKRKLIHPGLPSDLIRTLRLTARREFAFLLALLPHAAQDGFSCGLRREYLRDKATTGIS